MKAIKYLISFVAILSLAALCFSCMDEDDVKKGDNWCDGKSLRLSLSAPGNLLISPMTKSSQADSTITDLNVLIYKSGGERIVRYYDLTNNSSLIGNLLKGETVQLPIEVGENESGYVYAIANYGSSLETSSSFKTEEELKNADFGLDGAKPRLLMFADGQHFDVSAPEANTVEAELVRIYSMVTVQVVKDLNKNVDVVPVSIQLRHIPSKGHFKKEDNKIGANGVECEIEGEIIENLNQGGNKNALDEGNTYALFTYENMQPEGSNGGDQRTKTPKGLKPDDIVQIIETDRTCSYIELKAHYLKDGNDKDDIGSGEITYRFFLGEDELKNFEVKRNVHYQLVLTLTGNGGVNEGTWRVVPILNGEIQAPDVYVGYRDGSVTRMLVTGDVDYISDVTVKTTKDPMQSTILTNGFSIKERGFNPGGKGYYVDIQATMTNAHDYSKKVGEVTFTLKDRGGNIKTQTAKVYQVPRLVDPIAIYKKWNNTDPTKITVREYNPDKKMYETLESKGKWTATIKESSTGSSWFKIYNVDANGNSTGTEVGTMDGTIEGEGEVVFGYQPLSEATSEDRHGMILVKYHNAWCEHEIYLRQGYERDVVMNDDDGSEWSSFNCLGEGNSAGVATTSPTQTGWLFNGGINVAMHPFIPGYRDIDDIKYTDGTSSKGSAGYKSDVSAWETRKGSSAFPPVKEAKSANSIGKQGPCPEGYVLPNAWNYREMTNASEVTTGYVYDDDFEGNRYVNNENGSITYGWKWGNNGAIPDDDIHCNPAKGSLFIKKGDACTNLFFSYGKGVLTSISDRDRNLIPEIGVGHRDNRGRLTYSDASVPDNNHTYGGYYWDATWFAFYNFDGYLVGKMPDGTSMGKVDLGYDVFKREPNLIDVPGQLAAEGGEWAIGIAGNANASFVRCIKGKKVEYDTFDLSGVLFTASDYKLRKEESLTFYKDETKEVELTKLTFVKDGYFDVNLSKGEEGTVSPDQTSLMYIKGMNEIYVVYIYMNQNGILTTKSGNVNFDKLKSAIDNKKVDVFKIF